MAYDEALADARRENRRLRGVLQEILDLTRKTPARVLREGEQPHPASMALTQAGDLARNALYDPAVAFMLDTSFGGT